MTKRWPRPFYERLKEACLAYSPPAFDMMAKQLLAALCPEATETKLFSTRL